MTKMSRPWTRVPALAALGAIGFGATAGVVAAAPSADAATSLTITPNPRYANTDFQGWGTSLVWFANATGGYPDDLRESLYQAVFGEQGLDLNIARYNVGGENASDVEDYLRPGGAVDGWWAEDADGSAGTYGGVATDYASRDDMRAAFDPSNPDHYDPSADETQRWWIDRLEQDSQITHWEAFANSAPYFMTESGYVSGGFNASAEQLRPESIDDFARYFATAAALVENAHGIEFDTINPLNEPNTPYWGTTLSGGVPVGGRQEGMHVGPQRQADLIDALAAVLDEGTTTNAGISAPDETNPGIFIQDWAGYDAQTRANVAQMNVHTYGTGGRLQVRDLASQADKPLWMSEVEGSWVSGWNPSAIENGLGLAGRIHDDLRELEADAWVLWQPVEDLYNMEPQGENLNWGSVFIDLDCVPFDEGGETVWKSERRVADAGGDSTAVEPCGVQVNSKFNAMRHFTQFIGDGDSIIPTDHAATTAALDGGSDALTLVHSNSATEDRAVTIDLSQFGAVANGATATAYVTTEADSESDPTGNALVEQAPVAVNANSASVTVTVPAQSIASIVIEGVSGVADEAPGLVDGHTYQLQGVQSGLMLDSTSGRLRINDEAATTAQAPGQAWTVHEVPPTGRDDITRVVLTDGDGRVMAASESDTELREVSVADAAANPETRWIVNTLDGATFSLVNEALAQALDVGGQATSAGSTVGWWTSSGGANQRWITRDLAVEPVTIALQTDAGVAPVLPATVSPRYSWGTMASVPVTWDEHADSAWDVEGRVEVSGTATDVFGASFDVTAAVDVGGFSVTDPRSLTTYAGASLDAVQAAAPVTVPARVGASEQSLDIPVTWYWSGIASDAFAAVGTVTVPGTAESGDGEIPATLTVIVTAADATNINPGDGTTASATSTEGSYSVDNTRNQVTNDKGWSNWVGSNKPTQDTLTYVYDQMHEIDRVAIRFYADGGASSWAESTAIEYRNADGDWTAVPGLEAIALSNDTSAGAPVIDESFEPVRGDAVRVVLDAFENTHLTVSEVEVYALAPSVAAEARLATLRVGGTEVDGFDPDTTEYTVDSPGEAYPLVSAVALDEGATVTIDQATAGTGSVATVGVIAADGETSRTVTVTITRTINLTVTLADGATADALVEPTVTSSPEPDVASYQWYLDGAPVAEATGFDFTPTTDMIGAELALEVAVEAGGFDAVTVRSDAVVVAAPEGWSEPALASLSVGGDAVDGFSPEDTSYSVAVAGAQLPTVTAEAASGYSAVAIEQATNAASVARVTVTAGDGTSRVYEVTFDRSVGLSGVSVTGARAGGTATASAEADPAGATLTYQWRLDGEVIGGDAPAVEVPLDATGAELTVRVTASAAGYATTAVQAGPVRVIAPDGVAPAVDLAAGEIQQGGTLVLAGSGFMPGGDIVIELHSEPMLLATVQADATGAFSTTVTIPTDAPVGEHQIVVIDAATGIAAASPLSILAAADGSGVGGADGGSGADQLSSTGAHGDVASRWAAAAAIALALGGALIVAGRARRVERVTHD
ncbi:glycoside hydrolase [Demequina aestuarii]|uniref:glycoside hydrolase n=1 Tax=Demequina aestuarii TaxID=327095 RepID=UPI0007847D57|nr:glycoside hydrolase [Demequina aestuarii]